MSALNRRNLLLALTSTALLPREQANAQSINRQHKVAILSPNSRDHGRLPDAVLNGFLLGLAELGYIEGQNVSFEFRYADDALKRLPALAVELVSTQPDVLWTWASAGSRAAAAATSTIPIIIGVVDEETMASLVQDFAHPSRNITGQTFNSREQHGKCLELLKEAVPRVRRVAILFNPLTPAWRDYPGALREPARALGIELIPAGATGIGEVEQAFGAMAAQGVDAFFSPSDPTLVSSAQVPKRILELAAHYRLPSISDALSLARSGGLLSFGTNVSVTARRSADYVHRILQGAKPSELPVQRPTIVKLIVNLKTAEALGIEVPPAILARADEVIE